MSEPTQQQMHQLVVLKGVLGAEITTYTNREASAVIIPASWGWKMSADEPDPDGTPYAMVMGIRCVAADVPYPMLAYGMPA